MHLQGEELNCIRECLKRAGTSPVHAAVRETIVERQVHFQSSDYEGPLLSGAGADRAIATAYGSLQLPSLLRSILQL